MNRLLVKLGAVSLLGTVATLGSSALAAGTLVQGDGSFVGGLTVDSDIANVRAVLFQQGGEVTAIVQAATRAGESIGSAWILPIGGTILKPPAAADPAIIGELLRTTDPIYEEELFMGCSVGCTAMGDSGEEDGITNVGVFLSSKAGATWSYFGPNAVDGAIDSLLESGYDLSSELTAGLQSHAAGGGSFVVMFFTAERSDSATPAIVVRYQASEMMLPQALTALSADSLVQTSVLTITGEGATGPVGVPHVQPRLGMPLYEPSDTPEFYRSRVFLALDEGGDDAWLLEYSNTLDMLDQRSDNLLDATSLWEGGGLPWAGLRALVDRDLLGSFRAENVWITRWRTIQKPDFLADQVFAPDASVPTYEVYLEASEFGAAAWFWPMPLLLGVWALGRRRREV